MMETVEKQLQSFRKRLFRVLLVQRCISACALMCLVAGAAMLLFRFLSMNTVPVLGAMAVGLLVLLVRSTLATLRDMPSDEALTAYLDQHNGSGGLLMAAGEGSIGDWQIAPLALPQVRAGGQTHLFHAFAGFAFLLTTLVMPVSWITPPPKGPDLSGLVESMEEQVALLEETELLPEEALEELKAAIEESEQNDENLAANWESLDHLQDTLSKEAEAAAQELARMQDQLNSLEQLLASMNNAFDSNQQKELEHALQELADLMERLKQENQLLEQSLPSELMAQLAQMDAEQQMAALSNALQLSREQARELLDKLKSTKLLSAQKLNQAAQQSQGQPMSNEELEEFLQQKQAGSCKKGGQCKGLAGIPGTGIRRGRADAELTFKDPSSEEGTSFKEETLPPSEYKKLEASSVFGLDTVAPVENGGVDSQFGALSNAREGAGSAHSHTVLPRHRDTVRRYFSNDKPKSDPR